MEDAGMVNVYVCQRCGGRIVTKNRDAGTTPFSLECRATKGCGGVMYSSFYRVDQSQPAGWQWFSPKTASERKQLSDPWKRDHVALGGLLLREMVN